ncbi:MAG TPA: hypothetical protein VJ989_05245 [Solirubrobacterales bacterium]|nr:hypothetical protein [Solirubrobacterales bacterium]
MEQFRFDGAAAERSLTDPDGALWPVNAYSDADELDSLIQAALDSGAIARPNRRARLYIYPLSLSEPDPVLVYDPGHGRAFLGHALKLLDREDESPVDFTLRLLEELVVDANALAVPAERGERLECGNCGAALRREEAMVALADAEALDRLATQLNAPGCWNGGDVCELAAELLRRTGRRIEDEPYPETGSD